MSIADRLPPAPEGYKWVTDITAGHSEPNLIVSLDRDPMSPVYGTTYGGYVSTPTLDEEGVQKAAEEILENFARAAEEDARRIAIEAELKSQYAHLLT